MAKVFDEIDEGLEAWLLEQPVLFVGTAPLSSDGHVNVSPKGMGGTFAVLDPHRVAYLDYFGSGAETIAHLRENGRIVMMFCAFAGPPKIIRLHGTGHVVRDEDDEYAGLRRRFSKARDHGLRSIVVVDVDRIADSCGFSVPLMDYLADRDTLDRVQEQRPADYYAEHARTRNAESIDGLPALTPK